MMQLHEKGRYFQRNRLLNAGLISRSETLRPRKEEGRRERGEREIRTKVGENG